MSHLAIARTATIMSSFLQYKLVLLGELAVGKLSIVHRFVKNTFDDMRESTIGAAFLTQLLTIADSTTIKFEIWDTAGQERYKSLAPMYYRHANAALCVYDVTSPASFDRAKDWIEELQKLAPKDIVIALVGNKADLEATVDPAQVAEYVASLPGKVISLTCSAKSGDGVQQVFEAIAEQLPKEQVKPTGVQSRVELDRRAGPQQTSCC